MEESFCSSCPSEKRLAILKKLQTNLITPVIWQNVWKNNMRWYIEFFAANNLNSLNQSGFKPAVSCINQLLSITHEIYQSFDKGFEILGVFLNILIWKDSTRLLQWRFDFQVKSLRNIGKSSSFSLAKVFLKIVNKELSWLVKLDPRLLYWPVSLKDRLSTFLLMIYISDLSIRWFILKC